MPWVQWNASEKGGVTLNRNGYRITVPPAYTGVVFLFGWTYLMFYATSAGIEAAAPISLYSSAYSISALCMMVTLLTVSFAPIDRTKLLTDTRTKIIAGCALPIGTCILLASSYSHNLTAIIAGGIVTGFFSGIMLLQWIVAYQRIGLRVAAGSFPMLMAMSVALCATLLYLPHFMLTIATIVFPLISEIMFHAVRKQPWPRFEDEYDGERDRPINYVLMLLPFAVYAFSSGFLDYSSDHNNYTFAFYALGAFIPVIISGVYLFIVERQSFLEAFLIPLAFLVVVCVPFLCARELVPFSPFISIGELGIEVLIFVVPIAFAQFFSIDSLKTYSLGRVVYVLLNGIGWYAAQSAGSIYGEFLHSQVSLVVIFVGVEVLAVCLIVAIVKAQKNLLSEHDAETEEPFTIASNAENAEIIASADEQRRERTITSCENADKALDVRTPSREIEDVEMISGTDTDEVADRICREYGLSQRERDVFVLLAKGYTSTRIQKELYIAAGTVNYHSRNIYAKLGVHSKQELIRLFEEKAQVE